MEIKNYNSNSYYMGLVQNLYAGAKGCFSAFMHFFYQYNQSLAYQPELSLCFKCLYESELENCQILSKVLLNMGGDNKYYSSMKKYLSGYNVDYVKNVSKVFLLDVELLEYNMIGLKSTIAKVDNLDIKECLKQVLANKKKSLKILKEKYFKNNLI